MDINRDSPLPNSDPGTGRRGNKPARDTERGYEHNTQRNSPEIRPAFTGNHDQVQQAWQASDTNQPLTNQDEQRKITNAENSDNASGETNS